MGWIYIVLGVDHSRTEQRRSSLVLVMRPAHLHPHKMLGLHPASQHVDKTQEDVARMGYELDKTATKHGRAYARVSWLKRDFIVLRKRAQRHEHHH